MTGLERSDRPGPGAAAAASFLANGLFAQVAQILLLRELLIVLDGDELALGVMLAGWLLWVGLGAAVGVRARPPGSGFLQYATVLTLATLSLPPALLLVRLARPIFDAPLGTPLPLSYATLLAFGSSALPCLCIGMLFPLMVRQTGARPAVVYAGEAIGALSGGLLFTFALVRFVSPVAIAAAAGLICIASGIWLLVWLTPRRRRLAGVLASVAVVFLLATLLGNRIDDWGERARWERLLPGYNLVETHESPYGRYALLQQAGQFSLFLDGTPVCDIPDPQAGGLVVHTALLQHPAPRAVFIIGHGLTASVREARRHKPAHIDCVELDPALLRLLRRHVPAECFAGLDAPGVKVHHTDPVTYLTESSESYEAILIDVSDPTTLGLNRYYTAEFIERVAQRLRPGGVLALTLSSQENYLGPMLRQRNATVYHTVRRVLPDALATPGDTCLILARRAGSGDTASVGPLTLDVEELAARYHERRLKAPAYEALLYSDPFPIDRVSVVNHELASWPVDADSTTLLDPLQMLDEPFRPPPVNHKATLNTDLRPRAYWATRLVNTEKSEPALVPVIQAMPAACWRLLAGVLLLGALTVGVARMPKAVPGTGRRVAVLLTLAAGAVGLAGMALQILILLWYQSRVGRVYVGLALLTAAFMAGLSLGSLLGQASSHPRRLLISVQCALVAAGLLLPIGLPAFASVAPIVSLLLTAGLGGLLGVHFACCAALWPKSIGFKPLPTSRQTSAARWLYSADVIGAAAAAVLVAAVIVPVAGFAVAAGWAAAFSALALLAILSL